jgi:hypothetical protein
MGNDPNQKIILEVIVMKYKHIQAAHELRMWILTIATGVTAASAVLARHPEAKEWIDDKIDGVKGVFKKDKKKTKTIKIVIVNGEEKS